MLCFVFSFQLRLNQSWRLIDTVFVFVFLFALQFFLIIIIVSGGTLFGDAHLFKL